MLQWAVVRLVVVSTKAMVVPAILMEAAVVVRLPIQQREQQVALGQMAQSVSQNILIQVQQQFSLAACLQAALLALR
jgi:hypothetical protein